MGETAGSLLVGLRHVELDNCLVLLNGAVARQGSWHRLPLDEDPQSNDFLLLPPNSLMSCLLEVTTLEGQGLCRLQNVGKGVSQLGCV